MCPRNSEQNFNSVYRRNAEKEVITSSQDTCEADASLSERLGYDSIRDAISDRTKVIEERRKCTDYIVTTIHQYFPIKKTEIDAFYSTRELKYTLRLLLADLRAIQDEVTPKLSDPIQVDLTTVIEGENRQHRIFFSVIAEVDKIYLRQRQDQPNAVQDEMFSDLATW